MTMQMIRYLLKYYFRTKKCILPLLFFLVFIVVYFSSNSSTPWECYSFTSVAMFLFSAFITIGFTECEENTQQQITLLHLGNKTQYYITRIITILTYVFLLDMIIVFIPLLLENQGNNITTIQIIIALVIHTVSSMLGISISVLFDSRIINNRKFAILGFAFIIIISISQIGIMNEFVLFRYIRWLLPPIMFLSEKVYSFNNNITYYKYLSLLIYIIYSILYSGLLIFGYICVIKRKLY